MTPEQTVLAEYSKAYKAGKKTRHSILPRPGGTGKIIEVEVERVVIGRIEILDVYKFIDFQLDNAWLFPKEEIEKLKGGEFTA